jgi:hypothetical protein
MGRRAYGAKFWCTVVMVSAFALGVAARPSRGWNAIKDAKSQQELEEWNDTLLFLEAAGMCVEISNASTAKTHLAGAGDYFKRVERAVKKKHGGKEPDWMKDLVKAAAKRDSARECAGVLARNVEAVMAADQQKVQEQAAPNAGAAEASGSGNTGAPEAGPTPPASDADDTKQSE